MVEVAKVEIAPLLSPDNSFDDGFTDASIGTSYEGDFVKNVIAHILAVNRLGQSFTP